MEEFTDFECPFCKKAHGVLMDLVVKSDGAVRVTHRDFPLDMSCNPAIDRPFHEHACEAAMFARCAAAQDRFWPMSDKLFTSALGLDPTALRTYAKDLGLDLAALEKLRGGSGDARGDLEGYRGGARPRRRRHAHLLRQR
ncbi:MAG: thioredoxin domain-containing protein [Deltaproteobacteria bacterium]|nr:thioredoxin domain-containing protein [Deltaproteobacteria bacterium]